MKETYLKHLTVVMVVIGATIVGATSPDNTNEVLMIFSFILGYVFKNGYGALKKE